MGIFEVWNPCHRVARGMGGMIGVNLAIPRSCHAGSRDTGKLERSEGGTDGGRVGKITCGKM